MYDLHQRNALLKDAIYHAQESINRAINTLDTIKTIDSASSIEKHQTKNQLINTNNMLNGYSDYYKDQQEAKKLIEQGRENDIKNLEQKIEAGTATAEEVQQYNARQEGQMKQSMQKAMTEVTEIKVQTTAEIIR